MNKKLNYKNMSLDEVLCKTSYNDVHSETAKWLAYNNNVTFNDLNQIWMAAVRPGYTDDTFSESPLELALIAMNKITKSKDFHKFIFQTWSIDILTNDLFKDFLDKYLEKILIPNLGPVEDLKKIEKESLLLSVSLDISSSFSNVLLQAKNTDDKEMAISNFLPLLQNINKGEVNERLKCFESIDAIFSKTPLFKQKIMNLFGLNESNNSLDIVVEIKKMVDSGDLLTNYNIKEVLILAERYQLHKSLSDDLNTKEKKGMKPKI